MRESPTHRRASIRVIWTEPNIGTCAKFPTTPALFNSSCFCSNDTLCLVRPRDDLGDFRTNFDRPTSADPYTPDDTDTPTIHVSLSDDTYQEMYPCTELTVV